MAQSSDQQDIDALGKKVFFLYPSAVVQNRITEELIQQEFEVYVSKDHMKLRSTLKKFPNSIVFINISDGMTEKEWEAWIRGVMGDADTAKTSIGIVSQGEDESLKQKYLAQIQIKGGYIVIKSDLTVAIKQLTDVLMALEAKGRRKYIRAFMNNDMNTTINLPHNGIFIKGSLKDISVVGFSCQFDVDPDFKKNSFVQDIQLKLQTTLLKTECIVFGSRMDGDSKIYVMLFTQRIDPDTKARIRRYIWSNLQEKMDKGL